MKSYGVTISQDNINLAQRIARSFKLRPEISEFHSDDGSFSIDIATSIDVPTKGVCSSSTIGLSDVQLYNSDGESVNDFRVELVSAYNIRFENMRNVIFFISYYI